MEVWHKDDGNLWKSLNLYGYTPEIKSSHLPTTINPIYHYHWISCDKIYISIITCTGILYIYTSCIYIYIPNGVFLRPSFNNNTDRVCQHIGYKRSPKNPKAWSLADLESSCWWEGANPIHGGWASPVGLMGRSPHPHLPLMVIGLVGGNPENPERTYYKRILRVDFFLKIVVKKSPQLDLCEDHPIVGKRCSNVCCRGGVIFMHRFVDKQPSC